jgi:hypothetical protein
VCERAQQSPVASALFGSLIIGAFEAKHAFGAKPSLAFAQLLYNAQHSGARPF